jgi:hypothetical protein
MMRCAIKNELESSVIVNEGNLAEMSQCSLVLSLQCL